MVSMNGNGFESLLVCPVCLDAFKDPKVLPCLHTFCIKCISNCCKPLRREVRCPVCKNTTLLGPKGVGSLPNDFKVQQLRDAIQLQKSNKVVSMSCDDDDQAMVEVDTDIIINTSPITPTPKVCNVCTANPMPASVQCIQCSLNLCDECHINKHKNNRMFHHHQTISITAEKTIVYYNCIQHSSQMLRYYCVVCEKSLCTLCVMSHEPEHFIESVDKKSIETCTKSLQQLYKKIDLQGSVLRRCFDTMKLGLRREHNEINRAQEEIKNRSSSLIELIRSQENTFRNELQSKKNGANLNKLNVINEHLQLSLEMKSSISSVMDDVSRSPMKCFQTLHDFKSKLSTIEKIIVDPASLNEIYMYVTNDDLNEVTNQIRGWFGYVKTVKRNNSIIDNDQRKRLSDEINCGPSPVKVKFNDGMGTAGRWTATNTYNCDVLFADDSDLEIS